MKAWQLAIALLRNPQLEVTLPDGREIEGVTYWPGARGEFPAGLEIRGKWNYDDPVDADAMLADLNSES